MGEPTEADPQVHAFNSPNAPAIDDDIDENARIMSDLPPAPHA
jgi:hypothetical protein